METKNAKELPNDVEAEKSLLGSILVEAVGVTAGWLVDKCLSEGVQPCYFYDTNNQLVFKAICELSNQNKAVDSVVLINKLKENKWLEEVDATDYVQKLMDTVPISINGEHYLNIVKEKYLRRKGYSLLTAALNKCLNAGQNPDMEAVLNELVNSVIALDTRNATVQHSTEAILDRIDKSFDALMNLETLPMEGLSTGLAKLDSILQGLKDSEMTVIAARPSVGKTALAMNIVEHVAELKCPVMVFSLEMPVDALLKRMIASRSGVDIRSMRNPNTSLKSSRQDNIAKLHQAVKELRSLPIYVDDTPSLDIADLRARARQAKRQHDIKLIVIDYLQLCNCREAAGQNRTLEVTKISQQIKSIAKELKVPVIALSQLSRPKDYSSDADYVPKMSDLRDSGAIEQDADVVILLSRPERLKYEEVEMAKIDVAKNRNGEIGRMEVTYEAKLTKFSD